MQPVNVTICSPFRDSAATVDEYFDRLYRLRTNDPPLRLRLVCVEGDSVDDTRILLRAAAAQDCRVRLIRYDTGKPKFGSVVNSERFAVLAGVFNTALSYVDLGWSDYVLFLPSDIVYSPELVSRLLAHGKDIIAPFSWTEGGRFYDTWGFTKDNDEFIRFSQGAARQMFRNGPIEMDTIGGTVLIRSDVLKVGVRYTADQVDRGLCAMARAKGFTVWADPDTAVYHPPFDAGLLHRHIPNGGNLASIANLDYETVKAAIQKKYDFTPPDAYIYDFVDFVTALTR